MIPRLVAKLDPQLGDAINAEIQIDDSGHTTKGL